LPFAVEGRLEAGPAEVGEVTHLDGDEALDIEVATTTASV
jgi:hypothetical protein